MRKKERELREELDLYYTRLCFHRAQVALLEIRAKNTEEEINNIRKGALYGNYPKRIADQAGGKLVKA